MNVTLFKNFSKKFNSTKRPSGGDVHNCRFKESTSIESPILLIDGVDLDYNYALMNNHYYFIDDIVVQNSNIYELHLRQDLLATYKTEIEKTRAFILRSDTLIDVSIPDNNVIAYNYYDNKHTTVDRIDYISANFLETHEYSTFYTEYGLYVVKISAGAMADRYILMSYDTFNRFQNQIKDRGFFNSDWEYVIDIKWIPIEYDHILSIYQSTIEDGFMMNGHKYLDGETVYCIHDSRKISEGLLLNLLAMPVDYGGDWRDYDRRFTDFKLMIFGDLVSLDPAHLLDTLKYEFYLDMRNGIALIHILDSSNNIIVTHTKNIGVSVQVATNQMNLFNAGMSVFSSAASMISGNAPASIAASGNVIQSAATPDNYVTGSSGGDFSNIEFYRNIYGIVKRKSSSSDQRETLGLPYCDYNTLGLCTGYVQTSHASVDIDGLGNDKKALNDLLDSGIYIE